MSVAALAHAVCPGALRSSAMRPSMPLTNRPESLVEYSLASSTASLITTPGRELRLPAELVAPDAQDGPVDHRHALERPVLRVLAQHGVDLFAMFVDASDHRGRVRIRRGGKLGEQLVGGRAPDLELVAEAERSLAGLASSRHPSSPARASSAREVLPGAGVDLDRARPARRRAAPARPVRSRGWRASGRRTTRSPWMPGSVSVTGELDGRRQLYPDHLALVGGEDGRVALLQVASPRSRGRWPRCGSGRSSRCP